NAARRSPAALAGPADSEIPTAATVRANDCRGARCLFFIASLLFDPAADATGRQGLQFTAYDYGTRQNAPRASAPGSYATHAVNESARQQAPEQPERNPARRVRPP